MVEIYKLGNWDFCTSLHYFKNPNIQSTYSIGSVSEVGQQGVQEVTGSTSTVSSTTTQWTWTPADNNNNDYDSGTVYRLDSKLSATL